MSEHEQPSTQALAKASPDIFLMFDRADDARIIARIRGEAIKECVYAYQQGGQWVYGIGIDGAEELKREMAKRGEVVREDDIDIIRENPDEAYFRAKASRWAVKPGHPDILLDTTIELKRQEKFITKKNGQQAPNDFWLEQGGSKAMRNAILNLAPTVLKATLIEAYKEEAQRKALKPDPGQVDADVAKYHATMDAKEAREKKVERLKARWRELELTKGAVVKILAGKSLAASLADAHVSWSTVDEAVIDDLLQEAGR